MPKQQQSHPFQGSQRRQRPRHLLPSAPDPSRHPSLRGTRGRSSVEVIMDHEGGFDKAAIMENMKVNNYNDLPSRYGPVSPVEAIYTLQLCVVPAYALTIHKASFSSLLFVQNFVGSMGARNKCSPGTSIIVQTPRDWCSGRSFRDRSGVCACLQGDGPRELRTVRPKKEVSSV